MWLLLGLLLPTAIPTGQWPSSNMTYESKPGLSAAILPNENFYYTIGMVSTYNQVTNKWIRPICLYK